MRRTGIAVEARLSEFERARDAARALPGVAGAALSFITPFTGGFTPPLNISGVPDFEGRLSGNLISGGWFTTFAHSGHRRTRADRSGCERCAASGGDQPGICQEVFPGASPLGHTISLFPGGARAMPPMEIVGVVGDAVHSSLRAQVPPTWYAPLSQFDLPEFTQVSFQFQLAVRSQTNSPVASSDLAAAIGRVNPTLALTFRPLSDFVITARNQERLVALLAGAFGTLRLLLAGLGLYGITAYAVTVRRSEIGIRMALGAAASRIMRLVLVRVAIHVASGVVAGIAVVCGCRGLSRAFSTESDRTTQRHCWEPSSRLRRSVSWQAQYRQAKLHGPIQPRFYGRVESPGPAPGRRRAVDKCGKVTSTKAVSENANCVGTV
jgi:hypothetical protein